MTLSMIIFEVTMKHLKVRLSHGRFSAADCVRLCFRVSMPKCTRPSWGAMANRCTRQMRDSMERVLYKACDFKGFRQEVVVFKDLSNNSRHCCASLYFHHVPSIVVRQSQQALYRSKAITLSLASWQTGATSIFAGICFWILWCVETQAFHGNSFWVQGLATFFGPQE